MLQCLSAVFALVPYKQKLLNFFQNKFLWQQKFVVTTEINSVKIFDELQKV